MGWLSTHVLDTANGCPAADMEIALWQLGQLPQGFASETNLKQFRASRQLIKTARTNQDGRTDSPLLEKEAFQLGYYEIVFAVGDYFKEAKSAVATPHAFLNWVPIQFGIADLEAHYHVPLLVSPWSYSTYRGS
ncbi:MAG: hydroxyisourate hydrolase [Cyanobacteria bacterium J06623_4]